MPAYLIVNYDVEDADLYLEYQKVAGATLEIGTACQLRVLDPKTEQLEGEAAGRQTVVLEFETMAEARRLYESEAYQAIIGKRLKATSKHFAILVEGLPTPS